MAVRQSKKELELRKVLREEIAQAEAVDGSEIQANREKALNYYYGRLPAIDGEPGDRASIISTDVADMVNAVLAQMTPMLSTDCLVEFEAYGKEDEDACRAESSAVNNTIIEQNHGFIEFQEAIKDALLMRNCACKVYVDDEVTVRRVPYRGRGIDRDLANEELAVLLEPRAPNEERELSGDAVKVTTTRRSFKFEAVPIDNVVYEANAPSSDIQTFRFFAERLFYTRSELIEMGYDKQLVESLPAYKDETNMTVTARNRTPETTKFSPTRDQDTIECYEAYQLIDLDGDGVSERYKVMFASEYVLDYAPCDIIPYAVGTAFIQSHRLTGESLFDHLEQTQIFKTFLLRNWLDNQARINSGGRLVADPTSVDFNDLLNNSDVVKVKDMNKVPVPLVVPDIGPSISNALQYQDKIRTERGGAALDMLSADAQLVGETAYGIERQYGQREMLVSFMARNLAETLIRPVYIIMHEYMRRYANAPINIKLNGEWAQVNPAVWPKRERCNVKVGLSSGERSHIQRTLSQMLQIQVSAIQQGLGGQLADLSTIYNTLVDWATMAGIDNADNYVINPKSEAAQVAAQRSAQAAQQEQQVQQQLIQEQLRLEYTRLAQTAKEANDELAYKYWSDRLKSEAEEAKIVASGIIDLERVQMQGEQRETRVQGGAERRASGD
jgi:hypothetical protein